MAAEHAVVNGSKKADRTIADAVTKDLNAAKVDVTINDSDISLPMKAGARKTAFMVKNTGKETQFPHPRQLEIWGTRRCHEAGSIARSKHGTKTP